MKKDEVWEKIRNDDTTVYGEPMLHMFLKTTQDFSLRHWKELDDEKREVLGATAVLSVLFDSLSEDNDPNESGTPFRDCVKDMGPKLLQRLEKEHLDILVMEIMSKGHLASLPLLGDAMERLDDYSMFEILCKVSTNAENAKKKALLKSLPYDGEETRLAQKIVSLLGFKLERMRPSFAAGLVASCSFDIDILPLGLLAQIGLADVNKMIAPSGLGIQKRDWSRVVKITSRLAKSGNKAALQIVRGDGLARLLNAQVREGDPEELRRKILEALK